MRKTLTLLSFVSALIFFTGCETVDFKSLVSSETAATIVGGETRLTDGTLTFDIDYIDGHGTLFGGAGRIYKVEPGVKGVGVQATYYSIAERKTYNTKRIYISGKFEAGKHYHIQGSKTGDWVSIRLVPENDYKTPNDPKGKLHFRY